MDLFTKRDLEIYRGLIRASKWHFKKVSVSDYYRFISNFVYEAVLCCYFQLKMLGEDCFFFVEVLDTASYYRT